MKINWILILIALGISALSGYGFYAGTNNLFLTFGSALFFFITLSGTLGISFGRGSANIKVLSVLFFILSLIEHLIFAFVGFRNAPYIIITGILLLVYIMIFYALSKALK